MAINVGAVREGEPVCEINTTPLIDVMLVLLVMLIITLPQQRHAVKLDTPIPCQTCTPPDETIAPINVAIEADGALLWNGAVDGREELERRFAIEAKQKSQPELHIQVSRFAKYGVVAHVMAAAQRNGMRKFGIVGGT